jgi:hypothetical protein
MVTELPGIPGGIPDCIPDGIPGGMDGPDDRSGASDEPPPLKKLGAPPARAHQKIGSKTSGEMPSDV